MIGVVLITHGQIGQAMLDVASRLVEFDRQYVQAVSSCAYDQKRLLKRVKGAFLMIPEVDGFLVLTDLFGATPTNITQFFTDTTNLSVISGLNMPMLLKALTYYQNSDLNDISQKVHDAARACIVLQQGNIE
ncbi:PTS sugar transporter subunit IIA [Facilibium subflavum]|uniref:PTS sugar transporter subunit IIA n=1 Tax=Facilibium subflavum TaxID=2219058 RepID=UPI000E658CA5|nr:hypothetical protein [Facilibium subflavum]